MESSQDLRQWLEAVEPSGELVRLEGAHWDLEIGAVSVLAHRARPSRAVLFDRIKDHSPGFRVLTNSLGSLHRCALTSGLPQDLGHPTEYSKAWRVKTAALTGIPPRVVSTGPVMTHRWTGDQVNLLAFPAPRWHERDGGRYLGTAAIAITRDPDEGWINCGVYRMMVKDARRLFVYISPGKHGRLHMQKYFDRGERLPIAVSLGHHPLLFMVGGLEAPYGMSEYAYAGGLQGVPWEVIEGPVTGLPIPARAEIVLEGYCSKDRMGEEGPFGEWTGYYASSRRLEPYMEVEAVYFRDDPIVLGSIPGKPPSEHARFRDFIRSALMQEQLEAMGIPDVTGVWCHEIGGCRLLVVVGVRQRYPGHARQAGLAATSCRAGAYLGRFVVVVDEDIDVSDLNEVIWAVCTRCDPEKDIEIVRRMWSGPLDPIIPVGEKGFNSRAVIDATRPYEWKEKFPPVAEVSPQLMAEMRQRWGHLFHLMEREIS